MNCEPNCNHCKPTGELVGQVSGIDRARITIYGTKNGVVFWHPWENRIATVAELDDDFVQAVNRDITERGEW